VEAAEWYRRQNTGASVLFTGRAKIVKSFSVNTVNKGGGGNIVDYLRCLQFNWCWHPTELTLWQILFCTELWCLSSGFFFVDSALKCRFILLIYYQTTVHSMMLMIMMMKNNNAITVPGMSTKPFYGQLFYYFKCLKFLCAFTNTCSPRVWACVHQLLPERKLVSMKLRPSNHSCQLPICKYVCYKRSFIAHCFLIMVEYVHVY